MRLYEGTTQQFISDTSQNQIANKLSEAFSVYYGHSASPGEISSWNNSLQFLKNVIVDSKLLDNAVVLEYELPYNTRRIDCILFGKGTSAEDNVILIELKQWSKVEDCDVEGKVRTFVGGAKRDEPHPSYQVRSYHIYLKDFIQLFEEEPVVNLSSCAYCHNYHKTPDSVLFAPKFKEVIDEYPLFTQDDFKELSDYLKSKLGRGHGIELFGRFANSTVKPSKKLLEYTGKVIKGQPAFTLIDEQLSAYYTILDRAKKASKAKNKSVIIVRGGPGTGKSVVALNVLAELISKDITVFHATGSKAFTTTLRKIVGTRAANLFKYFISFPATKVRENEIDVLIADEAHRIRKTSNNRYTRREARSDIPQIVELIRAAKVSLFLIDDYQIVRPTEIGSTKLIKETAEMLGAEVFDFELKTQFRCSGSDGYLNWLDNTLGIRDTANRILTKSEKMEFKIFGDPHSLYEAIKKKNEERPNSARLVAGFCWSWSNPNPDGTLKEDVIIDDFKMTWEAKDEARVLAPGIPRASLWAFDPRGVDQVGSIYTIQGFEFDYVGVIVGKDFVYDLKEKKWIGHPENSADPGVRRAKEDFVKYVTNAYRVLLTRGMKGCYVYFMDKDTEQYFKSRLE